MQTTLVAHEQKRSQNTINIKVYLVKQNLTTFVIEKYLDIILCCDTISYFSSCMPPSLFQLKDFRKGLNVPISLERLRKVTIIQMN